MTIGLCGRKQSGKDTVGKYLIENYGYTRYAFADPIKESLTYLFGWSMERIEEEKEVVDERYGISPRQALIYIGTNVMQIGVGERFPQFKEKVGRAFWVKRIIEQIKEEKPSSIIITDIRFWHEYKALKEEFQDIKIVRIEREAEREYEEGDLTEKDIEEIPYDYYIYNRYIETTFKEIDILMGQIL